MPDLPTALVQSFTYTNDDGTPANLATAVERLAYAIERSNLPTAVERLAVAMERLAEAMTAAQGNGHAFGFGKREPDGLPWRTRPEPPPSDGPPVIGQRKKWQTKRT